MESPLEILWRRTSKVIWKCLPVRESKNQNQKHFNITKPDLTKKAEMFVSEKYFLNNPKSLTLLELFSGSGSVGKVADGLGYSVVSLDLKDAKIMTDILEWDF